MAEHELEKLLGAFAADTLTAEERRQLYRAALHDQKLFDALADEQALKELLADPAVRRRLLQSLSQPNRTTAPSWLEWIHRPKNLALAGGLASAVLALWLGTKIYQDSLRRADQEITTERQAASRPSDNAAPPPSVPQSARPRTEPNRKADSSMRPARKDKQAERFAQRERAEPMGRDQMAGNSHDLPQQEAMERDRRNQPQPATAPNKAAETAQRMADQPPTLGRPPAAGMEGSPPAVAPAVPAAPAATGPTPAMSARALFYKAIGEPAAEEERLSQDRMREEAAAGAGTKESAQAQEKKRADRSSGLVGKLEARKPVADKPMGLRYSLIMKGPGGLDMEVDPTTPVGQDDAPRVTIQPTEDGYLTVRAVLSPSDQGIVLFPPGPVAARKPIVVALTSLFDGLQTAEQLRLSLIFSRTPLHVDTGIPTGKATPPLLIEQVDPGQPGAPAEQAIYAVDPHHAAHIIVDVPLNVRP